MAPGPATEEKLRSLFVGPSLPVVTVSLTTPARPLPSQGPAVLTFPPRCPFTPLISGAKSPPWCSLRGGQPNSPGISCHCGQDLGTASCQVSPSTLGPVHVPRWDRESLGKLAKAPRSPAWQSWALRLRHLAPGPWAAPGQTHRRGALPSCQLFG